MAVDYKVLMSGDSKKLLEALKESDKALAESMKQVARLDKKLKDLERQMKESKNAAKNFDSIKKAVSDAIPQVGDLISGFAKFGTVAGAVGMAAKGVKNFALEVLNAGQGMDEFNNTMNAVKNTVGTLAQAFVSGDWDVFSAGILKSNRSLQETLDKLEDVEMVFGYVRSEAQAALAEAQEVVSDRNEPKENKREAIKKSRAANAEFNKKKEDYLKTVKEAVKKRSDAEGVPLSEKEMEDFIKNIYYYDEVFANEAERIKRIAEYNESLAGPKLKDGKEEKPRMGQGGAWTQTVKKKNSETVKNFNPKDLVSPYTQKEQDLSKLANRLSPEERTSVITGMSGIKQAERLAARLEKLNNKLDKPDKPEKHGNPGSPAYLEEKLKDLQEKEKYETDVDVRLNLQYNQEFVKNQLANINKEVESGLSKSVTGKPILDGITDLSHDVSGKMSDSLDASFQKTLGKMGQADLKLGITPMVPTIEHLKENLNAIQDELKKQHPLEILAKLTVEKKETEEQIKTLEKKEKKEEKTKENQKKGSTFRGAQELIKEYGSDKIEAYANPFLEVTNGALDLTSALAAFTDEGSQTAQVIGAVTQGIGQMAAQIPQLIASITALTSKETVEAGAEAAGAIASGAKSASKIPIVGGILAVAQAVALAATLFSTMSQAKKFAVGGIVPGNSFAGDKILSRLNSGEMVLNQGQQNRLFNMINSGASGNGSGGRDNVQFVLRGTDLIGLINNTQRKRSL